jgi:hypothetical protein
MLVLSLTAAATIAMQVAPAPPAQQPGRLAERQLRDSAEAAGLRFAHLWIDMWRVSEASRHKVQLAFPPPSESYGFRELLSICILNISARTGRYAAAIGGRAIPSNGSKGICPSWFAGGFDAPPDEGRSLDNALTPAARMHVRAARGGLIGTLDSALRVSPADDWLAGQLVRFMVDQDQFVEARTALAGCRATAWWCAALTGLVNAKLGNTVAAEAAFDSALNAMPPTVRCRWTNHVDLIDPPEQARYRSNSCSTRDSLNTRMWWLADPLYLVPGNERRVEQFVRKVVVELRTNIDRDERFEWRPSEGGTARRELIARYGWPSYVYWPGYAHDILTACSCSPSALPHESNEVSTTYEYARENVHLIPAWSTILAPFSAQSDSWTISDPLVIRGRGDAFSGSGQRRIQGMRQRSSDSAAIVSMTWWPVEHSRTSVPLVQLPDGQVAALRRESGALLAIATELIPEDLRRPVGSGLELALIATRAADSVEIIDRKLTRAGDAARLRGMLSSQPAIVALETVPDSLGTSGRTRFAFSPSPSLADMTAGDLAISPPVLISVNDTSTGVVTTDLALSRMVPSHRHPRSSPLGVYWETYGLAPSDTADISVWIERYTAQGIARRFGIALNVTRDLNTPVVVSWRETRMPSNATHIAGRIPVIGRTMTIDLSALPTGEYWLEMAVRRPGQEPVRARRGIVVF